MRAASSSSSVHRLITSSHGRPAPAPLFRGAAASRGDVVYCCSLGSKLVHEYNASCREWRSLPPCPVAGFALAVVNGSLVLVGGEIRREERDPLPVNYLHVYVSESGSNCWYRDRYPPMPTKRSYCAAVGYKSSLIVVGGHTTYVRSFHTLATVEVLDTTTLEWQGAAPLPSPVRSPSLTMHNSLLYLAGSWDDESGAKILKTDMDLLFSTCVSPNSKPRPKKLGDGVLVVWEMVGEKGPPVYGASCDVLGERLLLVGGRERERGRVCGKVWEYVEETGDGEEEGWREVGVLPGEPVSHSLCVRSEGVLLVIGGLGKRGVATRGVWHLQLSAPPTQLENQYSRITDD